MSILTRVLVVAAALVAVADAILHIATDQAEPLRIAGNVVVLLAAIGILALPALRRPVVPLAAAAINLVLNVVFIVTSGIGGLGAVLIALVTILLAAVAGTLRRRPARDSGV